MAHSKAKLKSNGNEAFPCFIPFLIGNIPDKYQVVTYVMPSATKIFINFGLTKHPQAFKIPDVKT